MEIDPLDTIEQATSAREESAAIRLNMLVAVTVAVLATFMGVCKVKVLSDEWMLIGRQESTGVGGIADLLAVAPHLRIACLIDTDSVWRLNLAVVETG